MGKLYRNFLLPTGLVAGTIIGAGVFALPYVFRTTGISVGIFYLFLATAIYLLVHLAYADIILRTSGKHLFVGLTRIYLGRRAAFLSVIMTILEMIFVMTIYLILSTSFINLFLPAGPSLLKLVMFWLFGSSAIFFSLKKIAFLEFFFSGSMIVIISLIFIYGIIGFDKFNINFYPSFQDFFLPLGPLLFSLGGRVAIPTLINYFKLPGIGHRHDLIKRAITFGTLIPAIVYSFFIFGVLSLSGAVFPDSLLGLVGQVPVLVLLIIGILGVTSLWSSYFVIGLDVDNSLQYDLKIPASIRNSVVVFGPVLLYFLGFTSFIGLVALVGGIFLALEGIFILLMWIKANKILDKPTIFLKKTKNSTVFIAFLTLIAALVYGIITFLV